MEKPKNSHKYTYSENQKHRSRSRTPPKDKKKPFLNLEFIPMPSSRPVQTTTIKVPWAKASTLRIEDRVEQLHEEILDFFDFMQPTVQDRQKRDELMQRVRSVTKELWPQSEISLFGSYETGLWLPNSDLDIVVLTNTDEAIGELINSLAHKMCSLGFVSEMDRVFSATVPILKFKDRTTGIYVDICFNNESGVSGASVIKSYMAKYPEAKYLVCVLKYFLKQRGLNDTYCGGVGSFLLFCMVIASIQHHPSRKVDRLYFHRFTLGHYLVSFLRLFGEEFNYEQNGISIKDEGSFFKKSSKHWIINDRSNLLSLECPQNPESDLGRCSFAIDIVKKSFSHAFRLLCSQSTKFSPTPLGQLIRIDEPILSRLSQNK